MGLSKDWDSGLGFGDSGSWVMWWVPAWVGLAWMRGDCCVGFQSISSSFFINWVVDRICVVVTGWVFRHWIVAKQNIDMGCLGPAETLGFSGASV